MYLLSATSRNKTIVALPEIHYFGSWSNSLLYAVAWTCVCMGGTCKLACLDNMYICESIVSMLSWAILSQYYSLILLFIVPYYGYTIIIQTVYIAYLYITCTVYMFSLYSCTSTLHKMLPGYQLYNYIHTGFILNITALQKLLQETHNGPANCSTSTANVRKELPGIIIWMSFV